ncbi:hypothetical protein KCG44_09750 [Pacificimonas sp. WHA3]|uniref:Tetratricopeptide repeat protein n=1 Tax=Pacificimonas pallii TaxID=2827236 RepID=A0ABS6SF84_9SPHN|nr:hypothetical protein [Pacificimonas pallii]MBV7257064.1 hypothetical protein [Pacificimonas pallii]
MNMVSRIAVAFSLALGGLGAATLPATVAAAQEAEAEAEAPYQFDMSRKFRKELAQLQETYNAGDIAGAQAALAAAEAQVKKPDEAYLVSQYHVQIGLKLDDRAMIERGIQGMLNSGSGVVTAEKRATFIEQLAGLALERGDKATAAKRFAELVELQPNNATAVYNVAAMQIQAGDDLGAVENLKRAIKISEASGQPADETWYRQVLKIAFDNQTDIVQPAVALVRAYPTAENWRSALVLFRDGASLADEGELDVFRLLMATNAMVPEGDVNGRPTRSDYMDYAEAANSSAYLGEADAALKASQAIGDRAYDRAVSKELRQIVNERIGDDRSDLASLAREAQREADGKLAASTATANLGYGKYAEAIALYEVALQKGGVNEKAINNRIGIAHTRMGNYAAAREAFAKVSGGSEGVISQMWQLHLDQKAPRTAAAPTAEAASPSAATDETDPSAEM